MSEKTYTLADLEQARRQGAEEERGRCIEAVIDATHGGALRSAVDAIRALGPIGETREETARRVLHEELKKYKDLLFQAELVLSSAYELGIFDRTRFKQWKARLLRAIKPDTENKEEK